MWSTNCSRMDRADAARWSVCFIVVMGAHGMAALGLMPATATSDFDAGAAAPGVGGAAADGGSSTDGAAVASCCSTGGSGFGGSGIGSASSASCSIGLVSSFKKRCHIGLFFGWARSKVAGRHRRSCSFRQISPSIVRCLGRDGGGFCQ
jgi:hypothetical protein